MQKKIKETKKVIKGGREKIRVNMVNDRFSSIKKIAQNDNLNMKYFSEVLLSTKCMAVIQLYN